ncbi:hypothetical protein E2C01_064897 [Portunus trituberculatus]|uniref:Uncharacterized protein n=1 Tax=Portunus trituberculatus TaxID=210409 RepID=A0A5B7HHF3_PORTR|nr:hypothetical protein [Portunus trituberculatus]
MQHSRLRSQFHFCILSYFSNPSSGFPKAEMPLEFCLCQLGGLRRYYADFPWNDYCFCFRDSSLCAERITKAYIPHSFSQPEPSKLWFNSLFSCYT